MKNTMLTTHLTDMLLQVEICLPCLIYNEQSMCISNQKLLKSVKAELNFAFGSSLYFWKKKEEENCSPQDVGCTKCSQSRPFSSNSSVFCAYRIATYLRQVLIPVTEAGLPVDIGIMPVDIIFVSLEVFLSVKRR